MRTPRKYNVLLGLTTLLVALLFFGCVREFGPWSRMDAAAQAMQQDDINEGAKIYAQNCVICHGPKGEGVVGLPLNRQDLKGDPETHQATFQMLTDTLRNGRPGSTNTRWQKVAPDPAKPNDYVWMSWSRMPNWHKDTGGPLDDTQVKAVAAFIMMGDWSVIGDADKAPYGQAAYEKPIPKPQGWSDADYNRVAKLVDSIGQGGTANCLSCHSIGSRGAKIGPDLSHVGSWTEDPAHPGQFDPHFAEFLHQWLTDPKAMSEAGTRMPWYWSKSRLETPTPKLGADQAVKYAPNVNQTQMALPKALTEDEKSLIIKYLLSLK